MLSILRTMARSRLSRPLVEAIRTAAPYFPVSYSLPDGRRVVKHIGDRNVPRIAEEVLIAGVYDAPPGVGLRKGDAVLDIGAHIGHSPSAPRNPSERKDDTSPLRRTRGTSRS